MTSFVSSLLSSYVDSALKKEVQNSKKSKVLFFRYYFSAFWAHSIDLAGFEQGTFCMENQQTQTIASIVHIFFEPDYTQSRRGDGDLLFHKRPG